MVARSKGGKQVGRGRSGWWWLALPVLGVAAWAAFDATLGLVSTDERPPASAPLLDGPPAADPPSAAVAAPAEAPPLAAVEDVTAQSSAEPAPSVTPDAARAAAKDGQRAAKRKAPAPKEDLTEQDRRALERVLERATGQGSR